MKKFRSQKGFTLIELLIVIVIIGILAGVLIAIINPTAQQNRAKDAGVKAALNKAALATEGFVAAYGRVPNDASFLQSLQNATEWGTTCRTATTAECRYSVTGNTLSADCNTSGWWGVAGGTACNFEYQGSVDVNGVFGTTFKIFAKSYGVASTVFKYDSATATITECSAASDPTTNCP